MQMVKAGQKEEEILSAVPLTDVKMTAWLILLRCHHLNAVSLIRFCSRHFSGSPRWSSVNLDICVLFHWALCLGVIFWHCVLVYIIHNIINPSDNPTFNELCQVPAFPCTGGHMCPPQNIVWHVTVGKKRINQLKPAWSVMLLPHCYTVMTSCGTSVGQDCYYCCK